MKRSPSLTLVAIILASVPAARGATIGVNFGNLSLSPAQVAPPLEHRQRGVQAAPFSIGSVASSRAGMDHGTTRTRPSATMAAGAGMPLAK